MVPILFSLFSLPQIPFLQNDAAAMPKNEVRTLASHEISLENRYSDTSVNTVFKENILLTIHYATDGNTDAKSINWSEITKDFDKKITLEPGETFAFHDDVLPQYQGKISKTTNAHFALQEGFKSDGYLAGDGVCHLASVLYWTAKDAGLTTTAPTRHDFAVIPDVPAEYGVSIYTNPLEKNETNEKQNLYITNDKKNPVAFAFSYDGKKLSIKAEETTQ